MCGFAGFWEPAANRPMNQLAEVVSRMADTLSHRGPDDRGIWCDPTAGIALGHRRLSIVDLSPLGHQPMQSACGRFWLIYNGEIYNHAELRGELESAGSVFRGTSDTEVLLAALATWGMSATLPRLIGMFAFAVWDTRERELTLVRDRLGIKPLYYGWAGRTFLFGSELKAFRQHPHFRADIDRAALAQFVQHNYVPAPASIYQGVWKLRPGTRLTVAAEKSQAARPVIYWSATEVAARARLAPFAGTHEEAADRMEQLLLDATRIRMRADVPLGAFLSGGIDSSTVVAAMQRQSQQPIRTFCIGFREPEYDEARYAARVASHLGTQHTEWYVTPQEAQDVIPRLPEVFDEPFADSSQIPTFLVSQLARRDVIVSLSGDGGDEVFGGYRRYFHIAEIASTCDRWRRWVPGSLAKLLRYQPLKRARIAGQLLATRQFPEFYRLLNRHWPEPESLVLGHAEAGNLFGSTSVQDSYTRLEQMMLLDSITYLPDDILLKVDRASMAHGLEARVPLLDHRLFEFAWSLPLEWRVGPTPGKRLLRSVLARFVPPALFERPKVGFGVPIDSWLRGPLREWAEELLSAARLNREGFFDSRQVRRIWNRHVQRRGDWHYWLWDILMFQSWHARWRG
ncbi:MAG: asparagine synthase (glutamine-hydrolyzing) [Pirellulaceae bacterium]